LVIRCIDVRRPRRDRFADGCRTSLPQSGLCTARLLLPGLWRWGRRGLSEAPIALARAAASAAMSPKMDRFERERSRSGDRRRACKARTRCMESPMPLSANQCHRRELALRLAKCDAGTRHRRRGTARNKSSSFAPCRPDVGHAPRRPATLKEYEPPAQRHPLPLAVSRICLCTVPSAKLGRKPATQHSSTNEL
jgi:hypothetical protein